MGGAAAQGRSGRGLRRGGGQGLGFLRGGLGVQFGKALLDLLPDGILAGVLAVVGVLERGDDFFAQDRFHGVVALGLGVVDVALILPGAGYAPGQLVGGQPLGKAGEVVQAWVMA